MNDALLSNLPRFDTPSETSVLSVLEAPEEVVEPLPNIEEVVVEASSETIEEEALEKERKTAEANKDAALEAALADLQQAARRIDQDVKDHAAKVIISIAATLFPKLSDLFLEEEIARHLPELIPPSAPMVEIFAMPEIAQTLQQIGERTDTLPENCTIRSVDHLDDGQVDISWKDGGVNFDCDWLLAACVAHLAPNTENLED